MDIITKAITTDGTKKSVPSIQSPYYFLERSYVVGAIKCSWWFERRRLFGNVPQTRYSPFLVNFSHFNKYRWSPWKLFLCVFVSTEGLVLSSLEDSNKGNLSRLCGLNFADSLKKVTNRSWLASCWQTSFIVYNATSIIQIFVLLKYAYPIQVNNINERRLPMLVSLQQDDKGSS